MTALAILAAGCDASEADRAAAQPASQVASVEDGCPEAHAPGSTVDVRAADGDLEALDCLIRERRVWIASREETSGEDIASDPANSDLHALMEYLFVRWRLTGEGWEELADIARIMPKTEIDGALYLSRFNPEVRPPRLYDDCGRVAEADPRHAVIALGLGDEDADCPAEP